MFYYEIDKYIDGNLFPHLQPTASGTYLHYNDIIMIRMDSQITSVSTVCSTVCSGADQRKQQSSTPPAFVRESTSDRWIHLTKGQ